MVRRVTRQCSLRRSPSFGKSEVRVLSLAKPLGLVLAPDTNGRIRVVEVEEGGAADKENSVARLEAGGKPRVCVGDVLRACTASSVRIDMARGSLTGDISGAQMNVGLMELDAASWRRGRLQMRRWSCSELGDIQLVLERAESGTVGEMWEEAQDEADTNAMSEDAAAGGDGEGGGQAPTATAALGGGTIDLDLDTGPFVVVAAALSLLVAVGFACY